MTEPVAEGDYIDVYKLTLLTGQTCFYGVESTAKAAARGTGTVELVRIPRREFALVAQIVTPAPAPAEPVGDFQLRVRAWMLECFGVEISNDRTERNHRFLEESLELVQSLGCTQSEAHQLVDYVFNRPVGEPTQEVGGVMVTLAALCLANSMDMAACGEVELNRIWGKVEQIRAKQAAKPKHSPLPEHPAPAPAEHPLFGKMEQLGQPFEKALHGNLDALQEAEHTAAEKHGCHGGEGATLPAADVPDVAGLIKQLNALDFKRCEATRQNRPYSILGVAADALAALQSQLAKRDNWLSPETVREHYLPLPELVGYENTIAQQAERIKELTAKLGESIEFIESMRPNTHSEVWPDIYAFLAKTREVMG